MFIKAVLCFVVLFFSGVVTAAEQDRHPAHPLKMSMERQVLTVMKLPVSGIITLHDGWDAPSVDLAIRMKNLRIGIGSSQSDERDYFAVDPSVSHNNDKGMASLSIERNVRGKIPAWWNKRYVQWDIDGPFFAGIYKQKGAGFGPTIGWKQKKAEVQFSLSPAHHGKVFIGASLEF